MGIILIVVTIKPCGNFSKHTFTIALEKETVTSSDKNNYRNLLTNALEVPILHLRTNKKRQLSQ